MTITAGDGVTTTLVQPSIFRGAVAPANGVRLSDLWVDLAGTLYICTSLLPITWTAVGGGGGGSVNSVTASRALASSGGANPDISIATFNQTDLNTLTNRSAAATGDLLYNNGTNVVFASPASIGLGASTIFFGDGVDGAPVFDGTNTFSFAAKNGNIYTLNRVCAFTSMQIDAGITVVAASVFCTVTGNSLINGSYSCDGGSPGSGTTVGVAGGAASRVYGLGTAGGAGAQTTAPGAGTNVGRTASVGTGGNGGSSPSGAGGVGGTAVAPGDSEGGIAYIGTWYPMFFGRTNVGVIGGGCGGGGGRGEVGTPGGAGAGGAGCCGLFSYTISGSGTITCVGGVGGAKISGTDVGGGGGGQGGTLFVITKTSGISSMMSVAGGVGGAGRGAGANGADGSPGRLYYYVV